MLNFLPLPSPCWTPEYAEGPDIRAEMDAIPDNPFSRMTWNYANPSPFSNARILSDACMLISSVFGHPPVQVWGDSNLEDYHQVQRHGSPCCWNSAK